MICASQKKVFTDEHRANLSAALKGRTISDQHRANLSVARKGRVFSDESRAKMSISQKNRTDKHHRTPSALQTPDGIFQSALEYAEFIGRQRITVYKRIAKHPGLYYFLNEVTE